MYNRSADNDVVYTGTTHISQNLPNTKKGGKSVHSNVSSTYNLFVFRFEANAKLTNDTF